MFAVGRLRSFNLVGADPMNCCIDFLISQFSAGLFRRRALMALTVLSILTLASESAIAATRQIKVTVKNDSAYTVVVTVSGFRGSTVRAILGPRSKTWSGVVSSQDSTCLITAVAGNSITSRVSSGQSRVIVNDRLAGRIKWSR